MSRFDPAHVRLSRTWFKPSSLEDVAEAISVATEWQKRVYVERVSEEHEGWRWSLQHTGGTYPLMRNAALFLKADHDGFVIFCTERGGASVLSLEDDPHEAIAWAFVDFDGPTSPELVEVLILEAFE